MTLMPVYTGKILAAITLLTFSLAFPPQASAADIQNVKFGILKFLPNGDCEMEIETTRITRRLKDTGFRYGVAFDNPGGETIEWYEVVRLPAEIQHISGDLHKTGPGVLQGAAQHSSDKHLVDQFWFDEGDPLGKHHIELYVNGKLEFETDFEVVEQE